MPAETNLILDALRDSELRAIEPHLSRIHLCQHQTLYDVRDEIANVYFALDAVVSLTVPLSTGEVVETAMVGRDGIIGGAAGLNGNVSLNRAVVQIPGACLSCPVEPLKAILDEHEHFRWLVNGQERALFAQAQQSAACNITHAIESRLARWLLRASDLHGSPELPLTQEYIAQMLGVRRTSVTLVAQILQQSGMISYKRGHIKLNDRDALQDAACECYQAVKTNYDDLFQPSSARRAPISEGAWVGLGK